MCICFWILSVKTFPHPCIWWALISCRAWEGHEPSTSTPMREHTGELIPEAKTWRFRPQLHLTQNRGHLYGKFLIRKMQAQYERREHDQSLPVVTSLALPSLVGSEKPKTRKQRQHVPWAASLRRCIVLLSRWCSSSSAAEPSLLSCPATPSGNCRINP